MQVTEIPDMLRNSFDFLHTRYGFTWLPEQFQENVSVAVIYAVRPDGYRFWFGYWPGHCEFGVRLDLKNSKGDYEQVPLPCLEEPPALQLLGITPSLRSEFESALAQVAERLESGLPPGI